MTDAAVFPYTIEQATLIVSPTRNITSLAEESVQEEWNEVVRQLEDSAVRNVVFDFSTIEYFGSSMLEAMLFLWKKIQPEQGRMAVCNVSATALEILRLSKFDTIWTICDDRHTALAEVNGE